MVHANGKLMRSFSCLVSGFDLIYHAIISLELPFSLNSRFVLCLRKKLSRQKRATILVSLRTYFKKQTLLQNSIAEPAINTSPDFEYFVKGKMGQVIRVWTK